MTGAHPRSRLERVFQRRKKTLAISVIVAIVVGFTFLLFRRSVYRTHSSIELASAQSPGAPIFSGMDLTTELQVIRSLAVMTLVAQELGRIPKGVTDEEAARNRVFQETAAEIQGKVSVAQRGHTHIIDILVESNDAREARDVANFTAFAYKQYRSRRSTERGEWAEQASSVYKSKIESALQDAEAKLNAFKLTHRMVEGHSALQVHLNRILDLDEQTLRIDQQSRRARDLIQALGQPQTARADTMPSLEIMDAPTGYDLIRNEYLDLLFKRQEKLTLLTESHPEVVELDRQIDETKNQLIRSLDLMLQDLDVKTQYLAGQKNTLEKANLTYLSDEVEFAKLSREVERLQTMLDRAEQNWQTAQIEDSIRSDYVRVLELALLPHSSLRRFSPLPLAAIILLGILIGVGIAFVQESYQFTLHTVSDVESQLRMPVLAVVPHAESKRPPGAQRSVADGMRAPAAPVFASMITHYQPQSYEAESFRILRAAIWKKHPSCKVVFMTSSVPGEGKTFVASNLAIACAQAHQATLLLEANVRRPALHTVFPFEPDTGLTHVLTEGRSVMECGKDLYHFLLAGIAPSSLQASPGLDNLRILPAGPELLSPTEAVDEFIRRGLLNQLKRDYDVIVIDGAPLVAVADSSLMAPVADSVLLVYRVGRTTRAMARRALDHLKTLNADVMGVVLNDVEMAAAPSAYLASDVGSSPKSPGSRAPV
ncbi:MAG: hypothetical protein HYT87_18130 [Nitrospirae bacterium]|nr:hypothetical protein [Nitrospirota bacterium]